MKYSKSYIDNLFYVIGNYTSKVELLNIACGELDRCLAKDRVWIIELCEIMNWQATSDRSGVWTYYEALNGKSVEVMLNCMNKKQNEVLEKYVIGIGKYEDESQMDTIDTWIRKNEERIYKYIEKILLSNKDWFYCI